MFVKATCWRSVRSSSTSSLAGSPGLASTAKRYRSRVFSAGSLGETSVQSASIGYSISTVFAFLPEFFTVYSVARAYLRVADQRALQQPHAQQFLGPALALRGHLGVEVQPVADQPLAAGRQVFDLGVAGIDAAVEHRDRALHQVQVGQVGEPQAVERMLGLDAGIVDRDLFAFDVRIDDRQHGRLLAGQAHRRVDLVLEEVADVARLGRRLHALAEVRNRADRPA